jgi:hypothetical protein
MGLVGVVRDWYLGRGDLPPHPFPLLQRRGNGLGATSFDCKEMNAEDGVLCGEVREDESTAMEGWC